MSNPGAYDPDAPEGAKSIGGQYVGRKDLIWLILAGIGFILLLIPIYNMMKTQSDETVCKRNMKSIAASIQQYAEVYDQRFPSIFQPGDGGAPELLEEKPIAWASVIPGLSSGATFSCPAGHESELVRVNGSSIKTSMFERNNKTLNYIDLNYGMLASLSVRPVSDVARAGETVLIAETSNHGSMGSYNPLPFTRSTGETVPFDAFSIGFDNHQYSPDEETKSVTRLAFRNTADGNFEKATATGRHKDASIQVIFVDGHIGRFTPDRARMTRTSYEWIVR